MYTQGIFASLKAKRNLSKFQVQTTGTWSVRPEGNGIFRADINRNANAKTLFVTEGGTLKDFQKSRSLHKCASFEAFVVPSDRPLFSLIERGSNIDTLCNGSVS